MNPVTTMFRMSRHQGRRCSLSLIAILLLHWAFGICAATADVLCIEADGRVMLEHQGEPCHEASAKAAVADGLHLLEQGDCVDLQADTHNDAHDSLPSHPHLADLPPPLLIPALTPLLQEPVDPALPVAFSTGPPVMARAVALRKITVLRI